MKKSKYDDLIKLATEALLNDELQKAAYYYESAFQIAINLDDVLTLGFIYLDLKNFVRAKEIFTSVLDLERHPKGLYGLGLVFEQLGNKEEAISLFEEAISLDYQEPILFFDCAYLYEELKQYDKAINYYLQAIALDNNYYWAHLNLGALYETLNDNEKALHHFLTAYKINKELPMVCYNLGVIYNKLKQPEKALKYYLEEIKKERPYQDTFYNLGVLYKDSFQDLEKAKYYYLLGLKYNPDHYLIWYNLGCVYALLEDYDNAYDCFVYLYYKDKNLFQYIKTDEELVTFRKSTQYQRIMGINP